MSGRWSTDADRRLFVAAFLQAYREMRGDPTSEELGSWSPLRREAIATALRMDFNSATNLSPSNRLP